ncbi:MAG TPA: hypothetical protein VFF03_07655 [Rhodocyclaceae bacterium]|nr:hypothetical protein [Rhodocyclaceae bacterium]
MQALLSFDRAPPFAGPLRFFLTAPLFGVLAGLLMVVAGPDIMASRWMPATLAATHLITVGFMLQIMVGALIQILPVVTGANLAHPLPVARGVHGGLSAGALLLAWAFLSGTAAGFAAAAVVLGATVAVFLGAAGHALWGVPSTSPTIRGLKLALVGLLVVLALGLVMALGLGNGWPLDLASLADLHAGWGLGAWAGILLVAMAYVVVPMFQLTPAYPAQGSWWLPPAVVALLLVWSGALVFGSGSAVRLVQAGLAVAGMGFAAFTLHLQHQRRRARFDATFRYWQGGLWCAVLALAMLLTAAVRPEATEWRGWSSLFGIVFGVGGFMSLIAGMLYKIVPFLIWLHLQNAGQGRAAAPNVNKVLADGPMQRQMRAHFAATALMAGAVFWPEALVWPAGMAFALANGWLAINLLSAVRLYRRHMVELGPVTGC